SFSMSHSLVFSPSLIWPHCAMGLERCPSHSPPLCPYTHTQPHTHTHTHTHCAETGLGLFYNINERPLQLDIPVCTEGPQEKTTCTDIECGLSEHERLWYGIPVWTETP